MHKQGAAVWHFVCLHVLRASTTGVTALDVAVVEVDEEIYSIFPLPVGVRDARNNFFFLGPNRDL